MGTHLRAMRRHLPYGITQCYLQPTPTLTLARQAGIRFTYPAGMKGWVDLGRLIAPLPGIELTTAWLLVQHTNCYATKPPTVPRSPLMLLFDLHHNCCCYYYCYYYYYFHFCFCYSKLSCVPKSEERWYCQESTIDAFWETFRATCSNINNSRKICQYILKAVLVVVPVV